MSHISDMHRRYYLLVTTLCGYAACVVLIATCGASHASGMPLYNTKSPINTVPPKKIVSNQLTILISFINIEKYLSTNYIYIKIINIFAAKISD